MRLILLSDIHGNLSALEAVLADLMMKYKPDFVLILGDNINYGMRPNEVIERLNSLDIPILVNVFGNHEKALLDGDTSHFSTVRGRHLLDYTRSALSEEAINHIKNNCTQKGYTEVEINGKKILAVHGSLSDPYWGKMTDAEMSKIIYSKYDYVFSGHSHIPHFIEKFYVCDNPEYRNRKRTVFINPGSVGQPRNHNSKAQYTYIDLNEETVHFNSVRYDIKKEQSLYPDNLDGFYAKRLENGI